MKQWNKSRSIIDATRFAMRGIAIAGVREQNVRTHMVLGTLVVCMLIFLRAGRLDIIVVLFAIALVISLEMINTCLELFADTVHPEYSEAIRDMKDIAAGAVLFASGIAFVIGILVFLSTIERYFL
ncbi:MAG: hypothetical protein A3C02_02935 [Candidatus Andersenbacteria bacterium RIFCSPHIGHO2_02_FULL_45_11]|uniref:Diacylglycerol kinase n=1 Tax=Candidatus Andersenbacteria bacterium RIFCSPHIGHO2_12_FULL_45_11 TaxID=1797281 RepID=A0A1G1X3N0_9BACT|nr:MAG: hypothetical protein A2805_01135 [Candidatus Andersenbacteria bacterium RIFCSPHIGHO2_01_FULL_46_36]OGY32672.1 MAG: hypothetical protein A3C02_02935 [Candidatus Andersenbacteria bacterium RIFCSPHIGHO2_02_FULL_45_11]OGY34411.1 MAG: hypothetical protein A3D99_02770 [Candidatus Andersenbacteria bacterium RIFCSPHIGHO2_12_FULL_45_11]